MPTRRVPGGFAPHLTTREAPGRSKQRGRQAPQWSPALAGAEVRTEPRTSASRTRSVVARRSSTPSSQATRTTVTIPSPPIDSTSSRSSTAARRIRPSPRAARSAPSISAATSHPAPVSGSCSGSAARRAVAQPVAGTAAQLRDPVGVTESEQRTGIGRQTAACRQLGASEQLVGTAAHRCDGRSVDREPARAVAGERGEALRDVRAHRGVPPAAPGDVPLREHRGEERGHPAAVGRRFDHHPGESRVEWKLEHPTSEIGRTAVGQRAELDQQGGRDGEGARRRRVEPSERLGGRAPGGEFERKGREVRAGDLGIGPRSPSEVLGFGPQPVGDAGCGAASATSTLVG